MSMKSVKQTLSAAAVCALGVLRPRSALAEWAMNMNRGVTELSREIYGLHMLIFWVCVAIAVLRVSAFALSGEVRTRTSPSTSPSTPPRRLAFGWACGASGADGPSLHAIARRRSSRRARICSRAIWIARR